MRLPGTPKYIVEGQVFLIPHNGQFIMAQVCEGLDLAIFDGLWDDVQQVEELGSPLFRVHFGYPTARGHGWKIAGEQPWPMAWSERQAIRTAPLGAMNVIASPTGMMINSSVVKRPTA